MIAAFNKWWREPDWEVGAIVAVVKFWITSLAVVGIFAVMLAPIIAVFSVLFWLIWK